MKCQGWQNKNGSVKVEKMRKATLDPYLSLNLQIIFVDDKA